MRELKFRVWDNENKSYNDPYSYAYYALTQDGGLDFYCHGDHMKEADPNVYFIEQCTGLKDKNGKEIYEGDIVEAAGRIYEVAWFEKAGGWFCFKENDSVYTPLYHLKSEIIGNIHENHELYGKEE